MTINLNAIGRFASENGAEIPAFDAVSQRLFIVAGDVIEILDFANPSNITKIGDLSLDTQAVGEGFALLPNSVAVGKQGTVSEGIVAVALAIVETATGNQQRGEVQFFNSTTGAFLGKQTVGFLPDMVTFTPDGTKVLSANEGEPNEDYSFDPEGSISIINLSNGVANATVQEATFTAFNSQIDQLRAEGVRIFGPDATVAQDVEPEYIAFSGDGTKAWVTLQENNAVAIVDIASATVESIVPLGFKDHSVNSSTLETYDIDNLPSIGTTIGNQEILLGGFSGLFFEGKTPDGKLKFITHTDRGPNGEPTGSLRPFLLPDYSPEIVRFELNQTTGEITITDRMSIKQADGTPITGLPNINITDGTGNTPYNDEIPVDLNNEVITPLDAFGADLEGIVVAEDGTFWMVDEYRPAIYHFNSDGTLVDRFVPEGTGVAGGGNAGDFGMETLPAVIAQRRQNRGFEAVALDSDNNKLYAFVQSPIRNPETLGNGALNGLNNIRIVEFDLETKTTTAEYLYRMDNPNLGTEGNTRADKIGDAVYIGNGEFLVVERDDDAIDSDPSGNIEKKVYRFSLDGATNITNQSAPIDLGNGVLKTVDQMTPEELASQGINLINKNLYVDLNQAGYNTVEKVEGLAYMGDNTIAVINDNDFQVAGITLNGDGTFTINDDYTPEPVTLGILQVQSNGLDASDRDGMIDIKNHPVFGMYMPDSIASYTVNGETYYVTANEGDARVRPTDDDVFPDLEEGDLYNEEAGVDDLILDPVAFPNFRELQEDENLGRLNVTNTLGQSDRAVFVSELDGSQEVPDAVTTEAQGEALAWVDDNGFLQVELEVTGLDFGTFTGNFLTETTADDVTALHIHEALRGENGGVVWNILTDADTVITIAEDGTANITSTWQENTIEKTEQGEDTEYYFNLHTVTNPSGEIRGQIVGEVAYDELYAFGARSFTIWDSEGNVVFDSGDDFERITAQAFPEYFNASNSNNNFDNRSDNKGPEPEGITVGTVYGETYAFVGLERIGGVMVYNVSNPETPEFIEYINTRNFEEDPETNLTDSGPEGLIFISAQDSPNGKPLLVVSNEVSQTTNVFEIDAGFTPPNQPAQMVGLETFEVQPVFTVGEIVPSGNGEYYVPPGILDGLGAFALDEDTVRVLANHELNSDVGYAYTLANGTQLTGGRVSFFDINKETRELEAAGLAYDTIINRAGEVVDEASDLDFMGLDRLCSAQFIIANQFGDNRGLVDGLFFTGEETDGGTEFVLDPESDTLYAVPWMGRAAWESVTQLDTGTTDKVALLIGDDRGGAPLLLYVGEKGQGEGADILVRNGLTQGKLYVWVADNGDIDPSQFNGTNESRSGSFVEVDFYRPDLAGNGDYDELGFATQEKQDALAVEVGAFKFSRPEDLATNPADGTMAVLASTGRDSLFPEDSWGTTYQIDVDFSDLDNITAQADIFYDGDDAGDGQFESPDFGLRSPDNLEWATNGLIYIQEDRSFGGFGQTSGEEASIWEFSPETGILTRIAQIDRTAVPEGQTDPVPDDIGNWESSGIIDVSSLFDETPGSLFLFDVEAHSLRDGVIEREGLVQGGQLAFLENTFVPFTPPNQPAQMLGLGDFETTPILTIGEVFEDGSQGNYVPPGILDGLGAFALDEDTIRVLANHELSSDAGYAYTLANGTQLTGGRVSFFDINKETRELEDAGLAYDTIINRAGEVVDEASDLEFMGLDRLCSAQFIIANQFGDNRGLVDGLFFTGEETDGGTEFVLDPESDTLYAVPWMGRAAWESVTQLDTGTTDKVALLIGDDRGGAPLLLYVGEKGQGEGADILVRNGLTQGKLYVWVADNGDIDPSQFNGTNESRSGSFVEVDFYRPDLAGNGDYDELGFATQEKQDALAVEVGAFKFSRPEDLATNPADGTMAVLASTGRDSLFPEDSWGTTYQIDVDFSDLDNITAQADIFYDGDDAGDGQFESPDFGLRSPDNLEWSENGLIYIQEDKSFNQFGLTSGEEASIWELNPETGILTRIGQIDRTAVPEGQTDSRPDDIGNWESSGIIDVSTLFDETPGSLFLFDVQAHSLRDGIIATENLVQGGQLAFLENTDKNFTLQLLHASDQEAGIPALQDSIGFSAVMNALDAEYLNTLKLSSGDLFIAGPFFNASLDIYGQQGIADILVQNALGWDAAAVGNHEFDAGPGTFYNMLAPNSDIQGVGIDPDTGYIGANFPYLATNLDYSTDSSKLKDLVVDSEEAPLPNSLTESVVIDVNGEQVGVIGAVVPYLPTIANIGRITMLTDPTSGDIEVNAQNLADNIQPFVDELVAQGINKIILMTHLQQFEMEQALATKLTDVDIIMGGGSHRVMANDDDTLRQDETQVPPELLQPYPQVFQDADGNDVYLINTGANYRYLGQLIVEFDPEGQILEIGDDSGTFATDIAGVDRLYEEEITTIEQVKALANPDLVEVVDNVGNFINSLDGTIFGNTEVYLNGLRSSVRTEETNLGNLTADANLWYAEQYGFDIDISVKNGGGIRDQIGVSFIDGGTNELIQLPPQANPAVGKEEGDVSELDISNSLRFDNTLSVADISAQGIKDLAEHFVARWATGATPGQFGQIGGFSFSFDPDNTPIVFTRNDDGDATGVAVEGERIQNLVLNREDGTQEAIVLDGELVVDPDTTYKMVILDFLAGGGDGYPVFYFENVVTLDSLNPDGLPNNSDLPIAGEQDALAEYLAEFYPTAEEAFDEPDTPIAQDTRIQNLNFRDDSLLDNPVTINIGNNGGTLNLGDRTNNLVIVGGNGDDNITTGSGNDRIDPAGGNNIVSAGAGDDVIIGSGLDGVSNQIDGGEGVDTVIYDGAFVDFPISVENGVVTVGTNTDTLTNIEQLQFNDQTVLVEDLVTEPILDDQIYRFRTGNGTYLYVGQEERQNVLQGNYGFTYEGEAFKVSFEADDDLISIYRFRNTNLPGSYLYVGEAERQSLLTGNNFGFVQEGLAFYTYGADAQQGNDIYRFSTVPGGYMFVGDAERQSIVQNYSNFTQEGIAFEALA